MSDPTLRSTIRAAAVLALFPVACSPPSDGGGGDVSLLGLSDGADVRFFTQSEVPEAVMDALFEGRVVADEEGCLRLDGPDAPTVIWPKGWALATVKGVRVVRNAAEREVGRIGGPFRLGGGVVPFLHEGIPMDAADREEAERACPGRYWIVGEGT